MATGRGGGGGGGGGLGLRSTLGRQQAVKAQARLGGCFDMQKRIMG